MKFLLDQDVPEDLSYLLHELGHEVLRLRDVLPQETADLLVLQFAHEHGCLLVTCNRNDFIELAQRQPHHGIIVHHQAQESCGRASSAVPVAGTGWRDRPGQ